MITRYLILTILVVLPSCIPYQPSPTATEIHPIVSEAVSTLLSVPPDLTETPDVSQDSSLGITETPRLVGAEIPVCQNEGRVGARPHELAIDGVILYQDPGSRGLYALDGRLLEQAHLIVNPDSELVSYGFSPDGKWFAYSTVHRSESQEEWLETQDLVLLADSGQRIEHRVDLTPLSDDIEECCSDKSIIGLWSGHWINNELLYMEIQARDNKGGMVSVLPKILDPYEWVWQEMWFSNLPDLYRNISGRVKSHEIGLSPDLTRVLYPLDSGGVALRDTNAEAEIWLDVNFSNPYGEFIRWSNDSQFVVVSNVATPASQRNLLILSRDGQSEQIVGEIYPLPELTIASVNWSPNGDYLALIDVHDVPKLYLYDRTTSKYLYYCPLKSLRGIPHSIWSPDDKWIAFSSDGSPVQLLNVQTGELFQVLDNAIAVGWSEVFPPNWPAK